MVRSSRGIIECESSEIAVLTATPFLGKSSKRTYHESHYLLAVWAVARKVSHSRAPPGWRLAGGRGEVLEFARYHGGCLTPCAGGGHRIRPDQGTRDLPDKRS